MTQDIFAFRSTRLYQFPHEITRWIKGDTDMYGKPSYTNEILKCRFQLTERTYVNEDGQHERSRGVIYTPGYDLRRGDLITYGDSSDELEPPAGSYEIKIERVHSNQKGTRVEFRYLF